MKKILLAAITLFCITQVSITQSYSYSYNNAGNRLKREYTEITIMPKSTDSGSEEKAEPVKDTWSGMEVTISPNPTSGNFNILIEGGERRARFTYSLYNSKGSKLLSGILLHGSEQAMDIKSRPSGVYFLEIGEGQDRKIFKILKK